MEQLKKSPEKIFLCERITLFEKCVLYKIFFEKATFHKFRKSNNILNKY